MSGRKVLFCVNYFTLYCFLLFYTTTTKVSESITPVLEGKFYFVHLLSFVWICDPMDCGLLHTWLPCASLSPGICSNSCPLSRWYHTTISSSVAPFFSCPKSFPASRSFPMSWLFPSGGQSIGASASASVLPMNTQNLFPWGLTGLVSLQSKGFSIVLSGTLDITWPIQTIQDHLPPLTLAVRNLNPSSTLLPPCSVK